MNGYRPTSSGLASQNGAASPTPRAMPHINDLKARAEDRLRSAPLTVDRMLEMAEQSTMQIDSLLDFRRPDLAYLEYIVASELVFNRIPTSRDAPLVREDRGTRYQRHKGLVKYLSDRADRLANIKEIIINDNKRSGVQPASHTNGSAETHARHASVPSTSNPPEPSAIPNPRFSMRDELFLETGTSTSGYSPRGSIDTGSEGLSGRSTPLSSVESPRTPRSLIGAEKLFDYLKPYNVLVIDVRNREDYDDGHIYVNSIMCIEPTALRPNMSADQLQEALVLSPDIEQEMFDRRNEFDLVVYYDQSTPSADFLTKSPRTPQESVLKYLYDALYEFNADKPLQRPPILLMGGLDACCNWSTVDDIGWTETTSTSTSIPTTLTPTSDTARISWDSHAIDTFKTAACGGSRQLQRTGLINFGVTCYMNATIQCLNATLPLTRIYRDGSFVKYIQKSNWRGSGGIMSENYATLIQNLWVEGGGPCRPKTLRELCARMNREWGLDRQQDAKEFFDFLVDILHEDMNVNWSHPPAQALTDKEEARRESLPKSYVARIEWMRWSMRERSIISELFGGQHMSRLRCTTCGFTSTTFETFYSISVEIPRDRPADIRDCLRSYCSEERLAGDEVWRCPRCKKEREASKKITITRAPHYLVIHFKRFSASHTERARKVRTPIEFPLNNLDLAPFMLPPITPDEETGLLQQRPSDGAEQLRAIKSDERMMPPYKYNAYAVMRHLGATLTSGHYVAMLKDAARGCWWQFNDHRVTEFQPEALRGDERLQNEQAYIVFYERERLFGR
ncbi:Ubiquitin c-terminal [Lasiodiplodia theobromae]|uniref:Ubiquitin c-terminal n=1 Tax=Lasiodiplodia theobromae TaxID=45133 RepID=UPI0015C2F013|nr:Ubiquitin c-terminal [Lasiodiplodia theobromae]KAF4541923.1 Ubiquitin c-terminal [Lasiodiplodia theobromae]